MKQTIFRSKLPNQILKINWIIHLIADVISPAVLYFNPRFQNVRALCE